MDPFTVLNIPRNASIEQIKSTYKKLALLWHPDKNNNSSASKEKFQEIQAAYEMLSMTNNAAAVEAQARASQQNYAADTHERMYNQFLWAWREQTRRCMKHEFSFSPTWEEFRRYQYEFNAEFPRASYWNENLVREAQARAKRDEEQREKERQAKEAYLKKMQEQQNRDKLYKQEMAASAEKERVQRELEMQARKKEKLERERESKRLELERQQQLQKNLREQERREVEALRKEANQTESLRQQAKKLAMSKKLQQKQQQNKTVEELEAEIKAKLTQMRQRQEEKKLGLAAEKRKSESAFLEKMSKQKRI